MYLDKPLILSLYESTLIPSNHITNQDQLFTINIPAFNSKLPLIAYQ